MLYIRDGTMYNFYNNDILINTMNILSTYKKNNKYSLQTCRVYHLIVTISTKYRLEDAFTSKFI